MMELLDVKEMAKADRLAINGGPFDGYGLMRNAGLAVARLALQRHGSAARVHILCGPGNNGGDGYVVAGELARAGCDVRVLALAPPPAASDAMRARLAFPGPVEALEAFAPGKGDLVIDAIFGAGLARPLDDRVRAAIGRARASNCTIIAIDLPSGISGDSGAVLGEAFEAALTVTFFRRKPGHLLLPGRLNCGEVHLADIGIADLVLEQIKPSVFENSPRLWQECWPRPLADQHKYSRGAVSVFSGGLASTGAARLAAEAAQRAGAGAVTLLSPGAALAVNACHLTSIILARLDTADELSALLQDGRRRAFVLGPGFGLESARLGEYFCRLAGTGHDGLVLDADAITVLAEAPEEFFRQARRATAPIVLTPHAGEFGRLFAELAADASLSKLDRARRAAELSSSVVIFKGPDTVIAAPDGRRAAINANGIAALATAGSGDVLAGIVAALLARKMPAFEAACAAVWLHGEVGRMAGEYCIAEDLPPLLPEICAGLDRRLAVAAKPK